MGHKYMPLVSVSSLSSLLPLVGGRVVGNGSATWHSRRSDTHLAELKVENLERGSAAYPRDDRTDEVMNGCSEGCVEKYGDHAPQHHGKCRPHPGIPVRPRRNLRSCVFEDLCSHLIT